MTLTKQSRGPARSGPGGVGSLLRGEAVQTVREVLREALFMRMWAVGLFASVVLACFVQGFAEQPTGPATLEGLLNSDETQSTIAADAGPNRPAGVLARLNDGAQHPDLDKAWSDYEVATAKVTETIRSAINKQFDAAAAKGDLDAAEKWQDLLHNFEKVGELPTVNETKAVVITALADYKKARDELAKAYEAVVKTLTTERRITEAKEVRDEWLSMAKQSESDAEAAGITNPPLLSAPREAVRFKGHSYYYFDTLRLSQQEAVAKCRELGGYLVRIDNVAEWKFIANYMTQVRGKKDAQEVIAWIDGSDSVSEGQWLFANGTPMTYFAFSFDEPSGGRRENSVVVRVRKDAVVWNDDLHTKVFGFICEWEAPGRQ
jgi:hypothetical protein